MKSKEAGGKVVGWNGWDDISVRLLPPLAHCYWGTGIRGQDRDWVLQKCRRINWTWDCPDSFLEARLPHHPPFGVSSRYKALFLQMMFKNSTFSKSQWLPALWGLLHFQFPSPSRLCKRTPFPFTSLGARLRGSIWSSGKQFLQLPAFSAALPHASPVPFPQLHGAPESLRRWCSSNPVLLTIVHPK